MSMQQGTEYLIFDYLAEVLTFWPTVGLFLVAGVYALKNGADWLVDGSANLGFRLGITPTMIGLTIVAFGTSAPELVVSVMTAAQGRPEICLGNVIGSNIANTALILGATAVVCPLNIQRSSIRFDGPISFFSIATVFVLSLIGLQLSSFDGLLMLVIFAIWMGWLIKISVSGAKAKKAEQAASLAAEEVVFQARSPVRDSLLIVVGLIGLVVGAKALVAGAVRTAEMLSVPDIVVGLTVVAGGTSLPELAVCLAAALRRQADITVGNVLGSNIFNAWLILGVAALIAPINFAVTGFSWTGDAGTLWLDLPICVLLCGALIPLMAHRRSLSRLKGGMLLAVYVIYLVTLVLRNLQV
jgi:cation:H+ antiporter